MINGIINVYKEKGFTSHDVVAKLRGILHQKKIGHTGTLDPDAVGVLPVCLGSGTKLCDLLTDTDKIYRASMLLGMSTDTQDTSGELLAECRVSFLENAKDPEAGDLAQPLFNDNAALLTGGLIQRTIGSFVGGYDQVPPMYSALKVNGKKLYELAREGREVERPARRVTIHSIQIESIEPVTAADVSYLAEESSKNSDLASPGIPFKAMPLAFPKIRVTMTVHCSKGTYIRTLCHDIGSRLGVGGCMSALTRIKAGAFEVGHAMTLKAIEAAAAKGDFEKFVTPVDAVFEKLPKMTVDAPGDRLLHNGNPLPKEHVHVFDTVAFGTAGACQDTAVKDGAKVRIYSLDGNFTAIYSYCRKTREFKVVKMFL